MLRRLIPDKFILWLLATIALALVAPVSSRFAPAVDAITLVGIFALFFLHGARLSRAALVAGFANVKLHISILGITFGLFPLLGLSLAFAAPGLFDPLLWTGLLFLCAVPSTVQSSIAYTSIAGGNIGAAVAAAAFSNLVGVFLTPLLLSLMLGAQGASVGLTGIGRIFLLLFLPFILGHFARPLMLPWISRWPSLTAIVDKGTILLAVYGSFSAAVVAGIFARVPAYELVTLAAICLTLLTMVLGSAYLIGRLGRFERTSRITILFSGSVKSLASAAPMAKILFPGGAGALALIPIMLYHTTQLVVCAALAARIGRRLVTEPASTASD